MFKLFISKEETVAWICTAICGAAIAVIICLVVGCTTAYKTADQNIEIRADHVYVFGQTNGIPAFSQELLYEQETGEIAVRAQGAERVGAK